MSFDLKVRRYDPESGESAYWQDIQVELGPERSVLDAILKFKADTDNSLGIRCSCQAAICGSCGVRINGQSRLACNTQLGVASEEGRSRTERSSSSRWGTCPCSRT